MIDHPAYVEEQQKLLETLQRTDRETRFLRSRNQDLELEIARTAGDHQLYNTFHAARMGVAFNTEQLANLKLIKEQAYFARLDFTERMIGEAETIYLGKLGLISRENAEVVIVDWREPIATLYYGGTEGTTIYESPEGEVECEVHLKRQMEIERDVIKRLVDAQISAAVHGDSTGVPTDEFLLTRLGQQSDRRLKDIVSTIQKEQNAIIRAPLDSPLVVQGVAGSGKTTVALHRLAYLLYRYQDRLKPADVLVIAPNRVFLTYISDVLPGLGVHDVAQSTLTEYLQNVYGRPLNILSRKGSYTVGHDPYARILYEAKVSATRVKGSTELKSLLEQAANMAGAAALPNEPLTLLGKIVLSQAEIKRQYAADNSRIPPLKRLDELRRTVLRLKEKRVEEARKEVAERYERQLEALRRQRAQGTTSVLKVYQEREVELARIQPQADEEASAYLDQINSPDVLEIYRAIITDPEVLQKGMAKAFSTEALIATAFLSRAVLSSGKVEEEDLAPLAYLRLRLCGVSEKLRFKHLVIDEGQDLTAMELLVLAELADHDSFTIVGDKSQSILPGRGLRDWRDTGHVFSTPAQRATLSLSYRTTAEIVLFSNEVLRHSLLASQVAEPVLRSGELPYLRHFTDHDEQVAVIHEAISTTCAEYRNIAVITRNLAEAEGLHRGLTSAGLSCHLLRDDDDDYEAGVKVIPVQLAKGLEFDAVIVANASIADYPEQELDAKLLYVALTRPMHRLYVLYSGALTPILTNMNKSLYQILL